MRTLSQIITEQRDAISSPAQTLVLFDDVLDPEKVLRSPEIEKLVNYIYERPTLSIARLENPDKLQDWLRDEQYKADVQSRAMTYPFKAAFEDMALDTYSNQYSGPLYAQLFSIGDTGNDVITITCCWGDGLFRNDYYVVGVIIEAEDLKKIL